MTEQVVTDCRETESGWECQVTVGRDAGTAHVVSVSNDELRRFAPNGAAPARLVEESFRFLLDREPKESILRRFALSEIERYFPDYPHKIRDALES